MLGDHAEAVAEGIAAEGDWFGAVGAKLVFDRAAVSAHLVQHGVEVVHVQVEVHRGPVPLVAPHFVAGRRAFAARWLVVHADAHVVGVQDGHRGKRSDGLDEAEDFRVEAQTGVEIRYIDADVHAGSGP